MSNARELAGLILVVRSPQILHHVAHVREQVTEGVCNSHKTNRNRHHRLPRKRSPHLRLFGSGWVRGSRMRPISCDIIGSGSGHQTTRVPGAAGPLEAAAKTGSVRNEAISELEQPSEAIMK